MTITLPDETQRQIEQRAAAEGFTSAEEYVGYLIAMVLVEDAELCDTISPEDWARSEEDIAAGRGRPAEEAIRELARAHGIDLDGAK
jgi:hypothetical protein